jgi:hypothetical protein
MQLSERDVLADIDCACLLVARLLLLLLLLLFILFLLFLPQAQQQPYQWRLSKSSCG